MEFNSLLDFAHHIAQVSYMASNMNHLIQSAQAASVGEKILTSVQEAHGDSSKVRDLEQSTQDERSRLGYPANEPLLRDGTLRDSYEALVDKDPSGEGMAIIIGSELEQARAHELGFINVMTGDFVQPRPVLLPAVFENEDAIVQAFGESMVGLFTKHDGAKRGTPANDVQRVQWLN